MIFIVSTLSCILTIDKFIFFQIVELFILIFSLKINIYQIYQKISNILIIELVIKLCLHNCILFKNK